MMYKRITISAFLKSAFAHKQTHPLIPPTITFVIVKRFSENLFIHLATATLLRTYAAYIETKYASFDFVVDNVHYHICRTAEHIWCRVLFTENLARWRTKQPSQASHTPTNFDCESLENMKRLHMCL